jgi:hypothetical protein
MAFMGGDLFFGTINVSYDRKDAATAYNAARIQRMNTMHIRSMQISNHILGTSNNAVVSFTRTTMAVILDMRPLAPAKFRIKAIEILDLRTGELGHLNVLIT